MYANSVILTQLLPSLDFSSATPTVMCRRSKGHYGVGCMHCWVRAEIVSS